MVYNSETHMKGDVNILLTHLLSVSFGAFQDLFIALEISSYSTCAVEDDFDNKSLITSVTCMHALKHGERYILHNNMA